MEGLKEFLAGNPHAKAEYQSALDTARVEGVAQAVADVRKTATKAVVYLEGAYPKAIKALAIKVLKGEATVDALEGAGTAFEAMAEGSASDDAKAQSAGQPDTPPSDAAGRQAVGLKTYSETGLINTKEALEAELKGGR